MVVWLYFWVLWWHFFFVVLTPRWFESVTFLKAMQCLFGVNNFFGHTFGMSAELLGGSAAALRECGHLMHLRRALRVGPRRPRAVPRPIISDPAPSPILSLLLSVPLCLSLDLFLSLFMLTQHQLTTNSALRHRCNLQTNLHRPPSRRLRLRPQQRNPAAARWVGRRRARRRRRRRRRGTRPRRPRAWPAPSCPRPRYWPPRIPPCPPPTPSTP